MTDSYNPSPTEGYICRKCRCTQGFLLPSGMTVVCLNCPWEEMVPAMIPTAPANYQKDGVPKHFNDLKDYEYQLLVLFKKLLENGPQSPDQLFEWSSRQYRFEHPVASYRF
jgi:hypothetical protein